MSSGIDGQVIIGPTRPGPIRVGEPSPAQLYQATIVVLNEQDQLVTRFTTDPEGRFRVALPPGTYVIQPESTGRFPFGRPQVVTVVDGQFTSVTVTYDTGMR